MSGGGLKAEDEIVLKTISDLVGERKEDELTNATITRDLTAIS
jgi:hypothetical protein